MINEIIKEKVIDKNAARVRSLLASIAYMATADAHEEFKDSLKYAEEMLDDLYEDDDVATYEDDVTLENYIKVAKLLSDNFSKKKCDTILKMGRVLFEKKVIPSDNTFDDNEDFFVKKSPRITPVLCVATVAVIIVVIILLVKTIHH
jgi:hypothetical protein